MFDSTGMFEIVFSFLYFLVNNIRRKTSLSWCCFSDFYNL
jgi:hypothetical protein